MNQSSLALRTNNATIAEAQFEIRTPSTTRARLMILEVEQTTATAQTLGVGIPAAIGGTPTSVAFQRNDPGDPASLINGVVTWGGAKPTAPTQFKKRWNSAAVIGQGIIWTNLQLIIPISSSVTLHNITAAAACDVSAVVDE